MAGSKDSPKLTDARLLAAQHRRRACELSDGGRSGTGLRAKVSPKGTVSFLWFVKDKATGKNRKITLGVYPAKSLSDARADLLRLKKAHEAGRLDQEVPRRGAEPADPSTFTVAKAAKEFIASLDRKDPDQAERIFDHDIIPAIGARPLREVTRDDVRMVVKKVVDRGSPVMARHVLAIIRQFFDWAVDEAHLDASPAAGRFKGKKALGTKKAEVSRRYLTPAEIPQFWRALDAITMSPAIRGALRLLLLTGLRTQEIRLARWSDVDDLDGDAPTLSVPPENQKNPIVVNGLPRSFVVPLTPAAVRILKGMKAAADSLGSPYVCASFAQRLKGDAKGKQGEPLTEKAIGHAMRRLFQGETPILRFQGEQPSPHDIRRTVRTLIEEKCGATENVAERVLNHAREGMAAIYAQGDLLDQRREVLTKWDSYVATLLSPAPGKVVPITAKAVRS